MSRVRERERVREGERDRQTDRQSKRGGEGWLKKFEGGGRGAGDSIKF